MEVTNQDWLEEDPVKEKRANRLFAIAMFLAFIAVIVIGHWGNTPPGTTPEPTPKEMALTSPGALDMAYTYVRIACQEDSELVAWYVPRRELYEESEDSFRIMLQRLQGFDTSKATSGGTIVLFCDGEQEKSSLLPQTRIFHGLNYICYLFDYRGLGESSGEFNAPGSVEDAWQITREVQKRHPKEKIALYGLGLGANLALDVAARMEKEKPGSIKAVIAESPFMSPDAFFFLDRLKKYGPGLTKLMSRWKPLQQAECSTQNAIDEMSSIPVFFIQGTLEPLSRNSAINFYQHKEGVRKLWRVPGCKEAMEANLYPMETAAQWESFLSNFLLAQETPIHPVEIHQKPIDHNQLEVTFSVSKKLLSSTRGQSPFAVEINLLSGDQWHTERLWLSGEQPSVTYHASNDFKLATATWYRHAERINRIIDDRVQPGFVLSTCQTPEEQTSRNLHLQGSQLRLRRLYDYFRRKYAESGEENRQILARARECLSQGANYEARLWLQRLLKQEKPVAVFDARYSESTNTIRLLNRKKAPPDGKPEHIQINGRSAIATQLQKDGQRLYFDIDDQVLQNIQIGLVGLQCEYYDQGTDTFFMAYDSHDPAAPVVEGDEKPTRQQAKSNTGRWQNTFFILDDARFDNRMGEGSDFYFCCGEDIVSNEDETITTIRLYRFFE